MMLISASGNLDYVSPPLHPGQARFGQANELPDSIIMMYKHKGCPEAYCHVGLCIG